MTHVPYQIVTHIQYNIHSYKNSVTQFISFIAVLLMDIFWPDMSQAITHRNVTDAYNLFLAQTCPH